MYIEKMVVDLTQVYVWSKPFVQCISHRAAADQDLRQGGYQHAWQAYTQHRGNTCAFVVYALAPYNRYSGAHKYPSSGDSKNTPNLHQNPRLPTA